MGLNENLVKRMGGVGDLAILSSSLLALKEKQPWRPLVLATREENMALLEGASYLDRVISIDDVVKEPWFKVFNLYFAVEPDCIGPGKLPWEDYVGKDRSDNFDALLGVSGSPKRFNLPVSQSSLQGVVSILADLPKPIIGLSPLSRSGVRTMPLEYVEPLCGLLAKLGSVVLFGKTENWSLEVANLRIPGVLNLCNGLNLKDMVALCYMLDLVISPDTAVYHVAAATGSKALALFGNIEPHTRITYYPTVTAIYPSGELDCIPCWDVPERTRRCMQETDGFGGECMRLLTPERIFQAVKEAL